MKFGVIFSTNLSSLQSMSRSRHSKVVDQRNSSKKSYSIPVKHHGGSILSEHSCCFDFCGGNLKNSRSSLLNEGRRFMIWGGFFWCSRSQSHLRSTGIDGFGVLG